MVFIDDLYMISLKDATRGQNSSAFLGGSGPGEGQTRHQRGKERCHRYPSNERLSLRQLHGRRAVGSSCLHAGRQSRKRTCRWRQASAVDSLTETATGVAFRVQSYTQPPAWYAFDLAVKSSKLQKTELVQKSPVDFSDIEVERVSAVSKDGTKVPMTILHKKGVKKTGDNPTILYGYGGFAISLSPLHSGRTFISGSSTAASMRSLTYAAAASSARAGTKTETSRKSSMCLMISSPPRNF